MTTEHSTKSPIDGREIIRITLASDRQIETALATAEKAQREWARVPLEARAEIVDRAVKGVAAQRQEIAEELCRFVGRPISRGGSEVSGFEERGRYMIDVAKECLADVEGGEKPGFRRFIRRDPIGIVVFVGIMKVSSDGEAIGLINDSRYGLTASVWTRDIDRAVELGHEVRTGTFFVNRCDYLDPALVWTGVKDTGRGHSLSRFGYGQLTRLKSFHVRCGL